MHPATRRSATRAPRSSAPQPIELSRLLVRVCRAVAAPALLLAVLSPGLLQPVHAQSQRSIDFGMMYTQERSKFVGPTQDNYFYLRGATTDVGVNLWKGLGISVEGTGLAVTNLQGSIDIEHIQFLGGPRYTYNWGHNSDMAYNRHLGVFVEGKAGYTIATSGIYPVNGVNLGHASALTYLGGGGVNVNVYHRFDLRLIEADYERTQLPNGGTNVQNSLRVASGINFHFGS